MDLDCPSLAEDLLGIAEELGEVFAVDIPAEKIRVWADSIAGDPNQVLVLMIGHSRNLIWTKEGGKRKLVLQTSGSRLDIGDQFKTWLGMPATSGLVEKGISISISSWTSGPNEVIQGADEDMLLP